MLAEHPSPPGHLVSLQVSMPLMTKKMRQVPAMDRCDPAAGRPAGTQALLASFLE